jgi:hypothetical protein
MRGRIFEWDGEERRRGRGGKRTMEEERGISYDTTPM